MRYLLLVILFLFSLRGNSQFSVTASTNATALMNRLLGPGVLASNAVLTCPNGAAGTFKFASTQCNMDSGIVLTSGLVSSIMNTPQNFLSNPPGMQADASTSNSVVGQEPDLQSLMGVTPSQILDRCKLEFDFIPYGDTIRFNYVFASEEYPDFNCSQYNDVFAFFIKGNFAGSQYPVNTNVAKVPGTNYPVSINTINDGTIFSGQITNCTAGPFTNLYVDMATNFQTTIFEYDGRTVKLTAKAAVTPCSSYHMKFAIADLYDAIYDSGVFLESGSFKTDQVIFDSVQSPSAINLGYPYIIEGCDSVKIKVKRKNPKSVPQVVNLQIVAAQTTATNGIDHNSIPTTITIPAFDTQTTFTLKALIDNFIEVPEKITLALSASECGVGLTDTIEIYILDFPQYNVVNDDTICAGQSKNLNVTQTINNPYLNFLWQPGNLSGSSVNVIPTATTNYTLSVNYPGCPAKDSIVKITVAAKPVVSAGPDKIICGVGNSALLTGNSSNTSPFTQTYQWTPNNATVSAPNSLVTSVQPTTTANYTLTVTNSAGCSGSDAVNVAVSPTYSLNAVTSTISCTQPNGSFTLTPTASGIYTYTLVPGNISNSSGVFSGLSAITYTVTASNNFGCTTSTTVNFSGLNLLNFTTQNYTPVSCNNQSNGAMNLVATGGVGGTINYTINPGNVTNTNGVFNNLASAIYTIVASDVTGCSTSTTYNMVNPPALSWNGITITNVSCNNAGNGSVTLGLSNSQGTSTFTNLNNSASNQTGIFNNLNAASYTFTAVDSKNCSISTQIVITQPAQLQITNISNTTPTCIPGNDASITFSASGGTAPYQYQVNNSVFQTIGYFSSLGSGTYTLILLDSHNCSATATLTIAVPPNPQITALNSSAVTCFNGNNGSVTTTASGGTGALNYSIAPSNVSNGSGTFNTLTAGVYSITVTDNIGCKSTSTTNITQPSVINLNVSNTAILCNSDTSIITIAASGGVAGYTYKLNNGLYVASNTFNVISGTYTITVKDNNNCTKSTVLNITQPNALNLSLSNTAIACFGGSSSISVAGTGGTPAFQYKLNGSAWQNSSTFNGQLSGTYTINIKDVNNCSKSATVTITQPTQLAITQVSNSTLNCVPANNATITIVAQGATPNYTYTLNSISNATGVFNNNGAGTYTVIVSDANACTKSSVYTINPPSIPFIQNVSTALASCINASSGTATVNVSAGNPPLTFSLNGSAYQSSNVFSGLMVSTYTVIVKDNLGCKDTANFSIFITASPVIIGISTTSASCVPGCDGTATVTALGGNTSSYTFSVVGGSSQVNNNVLPSLCPGNNYTVIVTDANQCSTSSTFNISASPLPTLNINGSTNLLCNAGNNGSINLSATGGTSPYLFFANTQNNNNGLFNSLAAGNYLIGVVDNKGCADSSTISITQPSAITLTVLQNISPLCNNDSTGSISISAGGGVGNFSYSFNGSAFANASTFSNLPAGTYTIVAKDGNNCTNSTIVTLLNPALLQINTASASNNPCWNDSSASIQVSASGGSGILSYNLSPATQTNQSGVFSNLGGTVTYTVTITDANNCSISTQLTVSSPATISLNTSNISGVTCFGLSNGSLNANANGFVGQASYTLFNSNYSASNLSGSFTSLVAASYTLQVSDANNCTASTTVAISQPNQLLITTLNDQSITCHNANNGSISVVTSGGNGSNNFTLQPSALTNSSGLFSNLSQGLYTVYVVDANNCSTSSSANISNPPLLTLSTAVAQNPSCSNSNDGAFNATATGGTGTYTFTTNTSISNNSGIFNNMIAGIYTITVNDANNCTASSTILLNGPPPLLFNALNIGDVACYGSNTGSINVLASGGVGNISYTLFPAAISQLNGNFGNLFAGTYYIVVKDANNCTNTAPIIINQQPQLVFDNILINQPICATGENGVITVNASGGTAPLQFAINGTLFSTNNVIGGLGQGTYTVIVKDANDCSITSIVNLDQPQPFLLFVDSIINVSCANNKDGIIYCHGEGGTSPYIYYLQPSTAISETGTFAGIGMGLYTINAVDSKGCTGSLTALVEADPNQIELSTTVKLNDCKTLGYDAWATVSAQGGTEPYTFMWTTVPVTIGDTIFDVPSGTYYILATDAKNCEQRDTVYIEPSSCCTALMPNAFSPNNDNKNDVFRPVIEGEIQILQFEIFDRWGNKVFSGKGTQSWDGTFLNKEMDPAVYFYVMKYRCNYNNKINTLQGDFTLVR